MRQALPGTGRHCYAGRSSKIAAALSYSKSFLKETKMDTVLAVLPRVFGEPMELTDDSRDASIFDKTAKLMPAIRMR